MLTDLRTVGAKLKGKPAIILKLALMDSRPGCPASEARFLN